MPLFPPSEFFFAVRSTSNAGREPTSAGISFSVTFIVAGFVDIPALCLYIKAATDFGH